MFRIGLARRVCVRLVLQVLGLYNFHSLTRLCLEGFLLNVSNVSGLDSPGPVPPTPGGGFPRPDDVIRFITI